MFPATPAGMRFDAKAEVRDERHDLGALRPHRAGDLAASEARFRALFGATSDAALIHDLDGRILLANDGAVALLELRANHATTASASVLPTGADAGRLLEAARGAAVAGAATFEGTLLMPSGRAVNVKASCRAVEYDGRAVVLSVVRDVTEAKHAEQLRAEFMSVVAHDIRNPLAVVLGYAEMLRDTGGLDPEREAMVARLTANARGVISLVSNYVDLARIEAGRLAVGSEPVDLNLVLQQVGEIYEDETRRRRIAFELLLDQTLPRVRGDRGALERAFGNLLESALERTPAEGRIVVQTGGADCAVATMTDTGSPIAAAELQSILERWRQPLSSRGRKGGGLGLFVATALFEAQGGTLSVDARGGSLRASLPFDASV